MNLSDIDHIIGGDLSWSNTGDLLLCDTTQRGQQRVIRRLLTNPGDYKWHPVYGGGIGKYVGSVSKKSEVISSIRGQMLMEQAVLKNPPPQIGANYIQNGIAVEIRYADADTQRPVSLFFDVSI